MSRPTKLFCYQLGGELHIDVDVIMKWPMSKIQEYMAYYITKTDEFKEEYEDSILSPQTKHDMLINKLGTIK